MDAEGERGGELELATQVSLGGQEVPESSKGNERYLGSVMAIAGSVPRKADEVYDSCVALRPFLLQLNGL